MSADAVVAVRAHCPGRWLVRGLLLGAAAAGVWLTAATGASAEEVPPPDAGTLVGAVTELAPVLDAAAPAVERVVEPAVARAVEPVTARVVEPAVARVVEPVTARVVQPVLDRAAEPVTRTLEPVVPPTVQPVVDRIVAPVDTALPSPVTELGDPKPPAEDDTAPSAPKVAAPKSSAPVARSHGPHLDREGAAPAPVQPASAAVPRVAAEHATAPSGPGTTPDQPTTPPAPTPSGHPSPGRAGGTAAGSDGGTAILVSGTLLASLAASSVGPEDGRGTPTDAVVDPSFSPD